MQFELEKLVSAELVMVTAIGNPKHYQANPASPIFAERRGIVLKTMGLADVLRAALNAVADRIRIAFVFGSVAKGTDTGTSDIDLMVVSDALGYADLFEGVAMAEQVLGRKVKPTLFALAHTAKRAAASSFQLRPTPGASSGSATPSRNASGRVRTGPARSMRSSQCAVGVTASRWALIS